jgi:hypothetical protein
MGHDLSLSERQRYSWLSINNCVMIDLTVTSHLTRRTYFCTTFSVFFPLCAANRLHERCGFSENSQFSRSIDLILLQYSFNSYGQICKRLVH